MFNILSDPSVRFNRRVFYCLIEFDKFLLDLLPRDTDVGRRISAMPSDIQSVKSEAANQTQVITAGPPVINQ